jgi:hypothetical protein
VADLTVLAPGHVEQVYGIQRVIAGGSSGPQLWWLGVGIEKFVKRGELGDVHEHREAGGNDRSPGRFGKE